MKNLFLIYVACFFTISPILAYGGSKGVTSAQFLQISPGAAAVSMGENYTATADNVYSVYYNPAAASWMKNQEIDITYLRYFIGANYHYLGYNYPATDRISVAAELTFDALHDTRRDAQGTDIGNINNRDFSFAATGAYQFRDDLSFGLKARYIYQKLDHFIENSFSFDIGTRYQTPVPGLYVGAAIRNIGPRMKFISERSPQPMVANMGALYEFPNHKIRVTSDLWIPRFADISGGVGVEYRVIPRVVLRGGYKYDPDFKASESFRAGIGFSEKNWKLDYAYENFSNLSVTHRISLSTKFAFLPEKLAEEQIPSLPIPIMVYYFKGENVDEDLLWLNEGFKDVLASQAEKYPEWFKLVTDPDKIFEFDPDNFDRVRALGNITGARYILYGVFRGTEDKIRLTIRVVSVVKGKQVLKTRLVFPMSEFFDASTRASYDILKKLLDYRHKRYRYKL